MEMMNKAIEDARDFRGLMEKIETDQKRLQQQLAQGVEKDERRHVVLLDRLPGENRAAHRARLKRERRDVKSIKVSP